MKKILISGGPVHAHLDDVKIITNKFKGWWMARLADELNDKVNITYLTSKGVSLPSNHDTDKHDPGDIHVVYHYGIDDYMQQVLELAPQMDAVVLGAAVANLIPKNKIEGKFPSHNYKPGDTIPIDFTIAPRIIDEVKKVAPKTHLFGFKLLSGCPQQELIDAAYGVLLESKAVTVFANDAKNLETVYAVTKEKGRHPMDREGIAKWILDRMEEDYYETHITKGDNKNETMQIAEEALKVIIKENKNSFVTVKEGYVFGTVALRFGSKTKWGFATTSRGKNKIEDFAFVDTVIHDAKKVYCMTSKKASLNAPLFHTIFTISDKVQCIQHYHHLRCDLETLPYATPGTRQDSLRSLRVLSFNIEGHGCILSFDKEGNLLK